MTFTFTREVLKVYHPIVLRWFLLSVHYRNSINYSTLNLEIASESVYYIAQTIQQAIEHLQRTESIPKQVDISQGKSVISLVLL